MNVQLKPIAALLAALMSATATAASEPVADVLAEVTVTGTREARPLAETAAAVATIKGKTLREARPTHPKDILNQVPGVWVSNLSGEGHSTAIRHPLTTSPVYLYLEDGVPTRSTGFFNHNALYEINLPQAGGLEVSKGPGSALYGSDAIGGTINVLTRTPPKQAEAEMTGEAGESGWGRLLLSGGSRVGDDGWRANLNLTRSEGWQEHAAYDRQAGSLRWDHALSNDGLLKTVLTYAHINQNHVGSLNQAEFDDSPRKNTAPLSYRKVEALRLSTAYEQEDGHSLLSITPFYRDNSMEILPNWSLSYDPSQYTTRNQSLGVLSKYRRDFAPLRARLIAGIDVDYSPGSQTEDSLKVYKTGTVYDRYDSAARIYDYDVTFSSVSPYMQGELSPLPALRVTAGLRYDDMRYRYDNKLANGASQGAAGSGWYGHAADGTVSYSHWSPKLGATYALSDTLNGFASYSNAFRTPSQGQVFRGTREKTADKAQAAAEAQLNLKPVQVDNFELGLRGKLGAASYEASLYHMRKKDDIVSYQDPVTNLRSSVNAGETLHRGVELGLGVDLLSSVRLESSVSYAKHTYENWLVVVNGVNQNYSDKEMEAAPRLLANTRLSYRPAPLNGGRLQLEWVKLGRYWQDAANTSQYGGHNLFNLSANYPFSKGLEAYGGISNLLDKAYAETSSLSGGQASYNAGLPRRLTLGLQAKW